MLQARRRLVVFCASCSVLSHVAVDPSRGTQRQPLLPSMITFVFPAGEKPAAAAAAPAFEKEKKAAPKKPSTAVEEPAAAAAA